MNSKKHFSYEELLYLYKYMALNYSIKQVVNLTGKCRSTIYRVIIDNSNFETGSEAPPISSKYKNCTKLSECISDGIKKCESDCRKYKKWICPNLRKYPYVCNFCEKKPSCKKDKRFFNPEEA